MSSIKSKSKSNSFIVPLVIYPLDLFVFFGDVNAFKKDLLLLRVPNNEINTIIKFINKGGKGFSYQLNGGQMLIYMPFVPSSIEELSTLNHEIFHITTITMNWCDIKLTPKHQEPYAYLIGYITHEIYKNIITF